LGEIKGDWRNSRNILLAMDPDVNRLDVLAHSKTILCDTSLRNTINLGDDLILASISAENLIAVLELVLGVASTSEPESRDEAICSLASARIDVHCVQGNSSSRVGDEANELMRH
jgi:hypothetical protein